MKRKRSILLTIGTVALMMLATACAETETVPEQTESVQAGDDGAGAGIAEADGADEAALEQESTETDTDEQAWSEGSDEEDAQPDEADAEEGSEAETEAADLSGRANADTNEGEIKILEEGDIAPDFTAELSGGGSFHLSDYDDKTVIINFWASWCGPCVGEMPAFEMLKNDNMEDLEIVCINCMEDTETVDRFIAENGYTFKIGYDVDGRIETYYPTQGIPYTLVVKKGVISSIFVGAMDADYQYREYKNAIGE